MNWILAILIGIFWGCVSGVCGWRGAWVGGISAASCMIILIFWDKIKEIK